MGFEQLAGEMLPLDTPDPAKSLATKAKRVASAAKTARKARKGERRARGSDPAPRGSSRPAKSGASPRTAAPGTGGAARRRLAGTPAVPAKRPPPKKK